MNIRRYLALGTMAVSMFLAAPGCMVDAQPEEAAPEAIGQENTAVSPQASSNAVSGPASAVHCGYTPPWDCIGRCCNSDVWVDVGQAATGQACGTLLDQYCGPNNRCGTCFGYIDP